jgi:RNA polymerase sigma-70 factor, ECF subfamily
MATTAPDISCVPRSIVEPYHERLLELTSIIGRRLPVLHRIALQRLNNVADAEDAVQDALLAAYTHVRQFRGQAQLSTWLTSIVINSARMKLRQRQRRMLIQLEGKAQEHDKFSFSESLADCRPDPEQVCRHRELSQLLDRSFRRLSPTLRRTLQLRTVQGLSIRETAQLLEVPVGTVKAQLARSRRKLREMLRMAPTVDQIH